MKRTLIATVLCLTAHTTTLIAPAAATPDQPQPTAIDWQPCADEDDAAWQCAEVTVPIDHNNPTGETFTKNLRRHRANKTTERIGTLVVNPGGPGTPATHALWGYVQDLPETITNRFDLLAIDARGANPNNPVGCMGSGDLNLGNPSYSFFPNQPGHVAERFKRDRVKGHICRNHPPALMNHLSSGSSARDIEHIRTLLGEEQLSFYSHAYGTHLTAVYASLYPNRVRASVADSTVDSTQFFGSLLDGIRTPLHLRLGSHKASDDAWQAALDACAASSECEYQKTIKNDWTAVVNRLRQGPLEVNVWGVPFDLTYESLLALVRAQVSFSENIPEAYRLVHAAKQAMASNTEHPRSVAAKPNQAPSSKVDLSRAGVLCADAYHPQQAWQFPSSISAANKTSNGFASLWGWETSICTHVTAQDALAHRKPIAKNYAPLIVHSTHDSALPLSGAQKMRATLTNSRLVTVDQFESSVRNNNTCAMNIASAYLLTGDLPTKDATCANEKSIFGNN